MYWAYTPSQQLSKLQQTTEKSKPLDQEYYFILIF